MFSWAGRRASPCQLILDGPGVHLLKLWSCAGWLCYTIAGGEAQALSDCVCEHVQSSFVKEDNSIYSKNIDPFLACTGVYALEMIV